MILRKDKPWKMQDSISDVKKELIRQRNKWLDLEFKQNLPDLVYAGVMIKAPWALTYLRENHYYWDFGQHRVPDDRTVIFELELKKGDKVLSTMDFVFNHDGNFTPEQLKNFLL